MSKSIRKLTIGKNPSGGRAPYFQVGTPIGIAGGDKIHQVSKIVLDKNIFSKWGKREYDIWVLNVIKNESYLWRTIGVGNESWVEEYELNF